MNGDNRDTFVALVNIRQALEAHRTAQRIVLAAALYRTARRMKRERLCRIVILTLAALVCMVIGALITLAVLIYG